MERRRRGQRDSGEGAPRQTARDAALRLLRRKPRTRAELSRELRRLAHEPTEIEATLGALEEAGYVNDAELARHYITTRAARLEHGRERLLAELEQRGVSRTQAEQAWNEALQSGAVEPTEQLRAAIRRRIGRLTRLDSNAFARVYNALLRAGFAAEEVRRELEPHLPDDTRDTFHDEETNDDLP